MDIISMPGIVRPLGRLDVRSASAVREALTAALSSMTGDIVLDVSAVDLVDAAGLGVIVGAHRRAADDGRRLILRGCSESLRRILALTRLSRVLHIEESETVPA